ncbi:trypsin-like peptidase domain-containing protein [Tamlana sp. 2201CG12-4]|uniref:S1C family serine protease n=1 Tax=Tamlana sp. 2201CG12-4 TaxID=3112582 RepID=UPI002DB8372C|nr:trypsin-like peptidase domain-containing protein [Tamlana sp. 2201CG12-4]MEC3906786.1 trypsin-like peptidase domain-containing protein [Tamlana sp. 2201CG12-4]
MNTSFQALILFLISSFALNAQDISKIYEKVSPAVVAIITKENTIVTTASNTSERVSSNGLGSGFMVSNQLVITAAHVVQAPQSLMVQFADGDVIAAQVLTSYKSADIALLGLSRPKENATIVKFGDSDKMKIGQQVFVVGVPLGVGFSLSSGYVSGFRKQTIGKNPFLNTEFIQTDAAINQGNSGGPMFNLNGEVVGIVSHITTKSGGSDGIGFASSSNLATRLLLNNKMPWFGAELYSLTGKQAKIFNLPQRSGLLVQRVVTTSIFGKMGVREGDTEVTIGRQKLILGGDIILSFNGIKYDTTDEALVKIADFANSLNVDSTFEITILREGKIMTLQSK